MNRYLIALGLTLASLVGVTSSAQAQYYVYRPVYVVPAPVPVVSYYSAPVVSYYPSVAQTVYYPPAVSYYQPLTTTVFSAPVVAAPIVTTPGYISSRSYIGYGVFRPRGVYTSYYYNPSVSYYAGYMFP